MIHLTVNDYGTAIEAPLFDLDYWTLRYQDGDERQELCSWDVDGRCWQPFRPVVGPLKQNLRLASEAKLRLAFLDAREREVHTEEGYSIVFEPTDKGSLVIVGATGDTLARMARGTGEWEVASRNGLWCPRIVVAPVGVALDSLRLEPTVRDRLSSLAERVLA